MKKTKFRKIKPLAPVNTAGLESKVQGDLPWPKVYGSDQRTTEKGSTAAHTDKSNGSSRTPGG